MADNAIAMRKSFTLLELTIVIVVLGILAAVIMPKLRSNKLVEASNEVLSAIRYTQHLAILDDKYRPDDINWYKRRWRIAFRQCNGDWFYTIAYDKDANNATGGTFFSMNETAIDPLTKKHFYLDQSTCNIGNDSTERILLTKKYNITNITFSCSNQYIGFDEIGRPYNDLYSASYKPLQNDCNITFQSPDGKFIITVAKETGYTYIAKFQ